jgi:hypothetical protein
MDYLGRRDHQVKIRGYRIELGEIETVLAGHAGVGQCVVVAREDSPGDQRLVAYVVPQAGARFDEEAARTTLRAKLTEYMVPQLFVEMRELPLTANGKIDRKALPTPHAHVAEIRDFSEALMTPIQKRVAAIWRDVLDRPRIGLHDNFFDAGGHSLLLTRVHAALRREFDSDIALVELFQRTTIATQAERLRATRPVGHEAMRRAQARAARLAHD